MTQFIAIDIGGTQMRAACYPNGSLTPIKALRITTYGDRETPLDRLVQLIQSVWPVDGKVAAMAAVAPGPVDPYEGVVVRAPNIPEWLDLPLRRHLEDIFHIPVVIGNDANLAALGEWKFGAGKGHHHMMYFTVSTGIGGGVIADDRLVLGVRGLATELGHVVVLPDGPACSCGQRGHLEAVAAGPAIARWTEQQIQAGSVSSLPAGTLTARQIAQAANQGDDLAIAAFARSGRFLGWAIADYLHIFNPSAVIIGGGVSRSGALLFEPLKAAMAERVINPGYLDNLHLAPAALGDNVGLLGALALAQNTISV